MSFVREFPRGLPTFVTPTDPLGVDALDALSVTAVADSVLAVVVTIQTGVCHGWVRSFRTLTTVPAPMIVDAFQTSDTPITRSAAMRMMPSMRFNAIPSPILATVDRGGEGSYICHQYSTDCCGYSASCWCFPQGLGGVLWSFLGIRGRGNLRVSMFAT